MTLMNAPTPPSGGEDFPRLVDYVGKIVILEPLQSRNFDTRFGKDKTVTECIAWWWDEGTGSLREIGQVSVFWSAVRVQLAAALEQKSQVAGRLINAGRRYELQALPTETVTAIQAHLL